MVLERFQAIALTDICYCRLNDFKHACKPGAGMLFK